MSDFFRSLENPLINYEVELNLRMMEHCVLFVLGSGNCNVDADSNNTIYFYYQKPTVKWPCCHSISKKQSKFFNTSSQKMYWCIEINIKQNVRIKE